MNSKKVMMNFRTVAIDLGPCSDQTASLQPFIAQIKHHNLLGLKLQIDAPATNEPVKVVWTLDTPDESTSPSSSVAPLKCLRNDDSGFSSDDNTQSAIQNANKISRSKSLRSAFRSTTAPTSEMHKTVRFADSLGLDLVHKNYYEVDDFSYGYENDKSPFLSSSSSSNKLSKRPQNVTLSLTKREERQDVEINHLIRTQFVCLQCIKFVDMNIIGTINVLNIAYEKQVYVRYTIDNWRTNIESPGRFKHSFGGGDAVDEFTFFISLPNDFPLGARCEFCIRYVVSGITYWDNNQGANYTIQAVEDITIAQKSEKEIAPKSFHPSKDAHNYIINDSYFTKHFLPFSMQSVNLNRREKRKDAIDKDHFFKCLFIVN
uniref:CBM21 domain-containing protein n=1 Tax=Setaria digitata TaxID=48799 RepID=A0A915PNH1_9BILA